MEAAINCRWNAELTNFTLQCHDKFECGGIDVAKEGH